ncbi:MAG TPA: ABC transporter permease [Pseudonocardiaceae bacterium]
MFIVLAVTPVFGLRLSGQWWLSVPLLAVGTVAFFAIGMLAGSFAKTEEAASAIANLVVLPMAFLSGTFFPLEAAPRWMQLLSQAFPLRHLNDGMSNVMVRGQGVGSLIVPGLILLGFAVERARVPGAQVLVWSIRTSRARSEAGYRLGIDRGSPNHGSTLLSKRVMAQIRSPVRVRT